MNSELKKSSSIFLAALLFITGCSTGRQPYIQTPQTVAAQNPPPELEFIADIPSLKGVSLKMSESKFLAILHKKKLGYEQGKIADETTYYVQPQAHVLVLFMFQHGKCAGVQRLSN
ncbi:MAG: hypothetical protein ABSF34_09640 [Verrucomicrobiota bacterium]